MSPLPGLPIDGGLVRELTLTAGSCRPAGSPSGFVVEAREAALVLWQNARFELAQTAPRHGDFHIAEVSLHPLPARPLRLLTLKRLAESEPKSFRISALQ